MSAQSVLSVIAPVAPVGGAVASSAQAEDAGLFAGLLDDGAELEAEGDDPAGKADIGEGDTAPAAIAPAPALLVVVPAPPEVAASEPVDPTLSAVGADAASLPEVAAPAAAGPQTGPTPPDPAPVSPPPPVPTAPGPDAATPTPEQAEADASGLDVQASVPTPPDAETVDAARTPIPPQPAPAEVKPRTAAAIASPTPDPKAEDAAPDKPTTGSSPSGAPTSTASPAAAKGPAPGAPPAVAQAPAPLDRGEAAPVASQADTPAPAETGPGRDLGLSTLSRATVETTAQIAAQIVRRLEGRSTRFEMTLTPGELGRVDVSLEIDEHGKLAARLAFDNPAAATDLRGRADELRRQLETAGFQLTEDALDFAERDARNGQAFDRGAQRERALPFAAAGRIAAQAEAAVAPPAWIPLSLTPRGVDVKV